MNDKDIKEYHKMVDKLSRQQKELDASYKQSLANKQERVTKNQGLKKSSNTTTYKENSSRTPDQGPGFMT